MSSTTTFCKVCKDAGKPEKMFTNHNVKRNGITVCPTLLSYSCRYCDLKGHTIKFCTRKKKDEEMQKNPVKKQPIAKVKEPVAKAKPSNVFNCLESDSESEAEEDKKEIIKDRPAIVKPTIIIPSQITYASMAKKEPVPEPKPEVESVFEPQLPKIKILKKRENRNWYDVYSDESDTDDDN